MPFVAAIGGAALASSFAAPAIISAVGATSVFATTAITVGTAAAGGALGSSLAGGSARQGALIGAGVGLVGPAIGVGPEGTLFSGGASGLFGGAPTAAGAATTGVTGAGVAGATPAVAGATPAVAGAGTAAAAPAAGGLLGGLSGNLGQALTMMALSSFGKAPQDLTEQERRAMAEQARRQGIEENVFNQAFEQARMTAQRAVPDSEGAFARQQIASARALEEDVRGASSGQRDAARRRAQLGGLRTAAGATAAEQARADSAAGAASSAFAGLRPPSQSAAEQSLAIYGDLYNRRQDYASELAGAAGTLFA